MEDSDARWPVLAWLIRTGLPIGPHPHLLGVSGWKLAMLEIRIERPVSRTDKSFQQDALSSCDRGSMDQRPGVVGFSTERWTRFQPFQLWHRNYQGVFLGNWKVENLCMPKVD